MKKTVRFLSLALVVILVFSVLSACGASDKKLYISVIAKGFQHQFWQVVKQGSEAAGKDLGVDVYFTGPEGESAVATQVNMLNQEIAKKPAAICLAALDTNSVLSQLQTAQDSKIPVIGFDSGVPNAPAGQIAATAATNNEGAAAIGAEKMYAALKDKIAAGKTTVVVFSQDATSASITGRSKGFVDKFKALVEADGKKAAVTGGMSTLNTGDASSADCTIDVVIGATPDIKDMTSAANSLLQKPNLVGLFCSNEGSVNGYLAALTAGAKAPTGLVIVGFDAGKNQKASVKSGQFLGSITQDPYQIGYKAVDLAVKAAKGESVADVDTGAKWYDKSNMDQADIAKLLYD